MQECAVIAIPDERWGRDSQRYYRAEAGNGRER
jgi:hypothetical protein